MTDTESLTRSATESSEFFDNLLDLVPAAYYFSMRGKVANQRYWQNLKEAAPKMELKQKTKKALKSALIGDDLSKKSVKDLIASGFEDQSSDSETESNRTDSDQEDIDESENGSSNGDYSDDEEILGDGGSEDEDQSEEGDSEEDDSDDEDAPRSRSGGVSFVPKGKIGGVNLGERSSELRQKLLSRINDWRSTRKAAPIDEDGHELKDQAPHSKRRAVKEAKAAKSGKPELSRREMKNLKKRKRKEEALKSMARSAPRPAPETTRGGDDSDEEQMPVKKKAKVVEDISFGKVQFEDGHAKTHFEKKGEKKLTKEQQLAKLQREKAYAKKLQGTEEGEQLSESKAWDKTFKRLEGEKVKDRADLLKKAIKREESAKRKSKREWSERKASVKSSMDEKAKKRASNIKARLDTIKLKRTPGGKKKSSKKK